MIGNLLTLAMGVTGSQTVQWQRFKSRTTNAAGHKVPVYYDAASLRGSVQPVPQSRYQALGLDFAKEYVTLYTLAGVVGVERDGAGDRIVWNGKTYNAESDTDWTAQAGWRAVLCVRIK